MFPAQMYRQDRQTGTKTTQRWTQSCCRGLLYSILFGGKEAAFRICWWFTLSVCRSVGVDILPLVCVACLTPHANIRLWVHELSEAVARGRPARLQHWCVGAAAPSGGRLPGVVRSFVLRSPHEHLPPPAAMPPATAHLTGYQARRRVTWHAQPMRAASISCAHDLITRERHLIHATAD